jgi:hypothetical protein
MKEKRGIYMKKFLLITLIIASINVIPVFAESPVQILFNSKKIEMNQNPVMQNGTVLVPLRTVFEKLGLTVGWDGTTQTITGSKASLDIKLSVDNKVAYVNGEKKALTVAPQLINGNVMIPLRFVAEATGCEVNWNDNTQFITIITKNCNVNNLKAYIDQYSVKTIIEPSKKDLEAQKLYAVDGTGKYEGFKVLKGYQDEDKYVVYFSGGVSNGVTSYEVHYDADILDMDSLYTWTYNGRKYTNRVGDIREFISNRVQLASYLNANESQFTQDALSDIFGRVYEDYSNDIGYSSTASSLVEQYFNMINGNTSSNRVNYDVKHRAINPVTGEQFDFSKYCDAINKGLSDSKFMGYYRKDQDDPSLTNYYNDSSTDLDGIVVRSDPNSSEFNKVVNEFHDNWITNDELDQTYGIYAWLNGTKIQLLKNSETIITLPNAPKDKFEEGKIYKGNGIEFQYVDKLTLGNESEDIGKICFNRKQLKEKGIIK